MSTRELEALIERTLRDPRIPASTRQRVDAVLAHGPLDPEALTVFCAQAVAIAQAAKSSAAMRDALGWLVKLADASRAAPASRACFSPGDDCLDLIREEFDRARHRADVCVFTITDDRIRSAMLGARRRGVRLRIISDNDKAGDEGSDVLALRDAGVETRVDDTDAHMHHKFAIFDDARLLTGSYNWTRSAANYNQENVVVTEDAALVESFSREFERLWASFSTPRGRRSGGSRGRR
ncbi:MAG: phospholipase D-like domain-containing protein [Polyangiales bacterium]